MLDVSIIIVNYNTKKLVVDAINSIHEKTLEISYEVIVVDNDSKDNSVAELQECFGDKINVIASSVNLGFGRANNKGAEVAKGRNIFLLNPDTLLTNNAIKILCNYLDANPKCGAVGGNLVDEVHKPAPSFGRMYFSAWFELNRLFLNIPLIVLYGKNTIHNYHKRPLKVKHIVGADIMIRADVYKQSGGFDPDFFMYCEETELCWRIHQMGYEFYCIPDAIIVHLEGKSFDYNEARELRRLEGRDVYYRKCHSKRHTQIANWIGLYAAGVRSLIFSIFGNKKQREIYKYRYEIFKKYNKL